MAFDFGAFAAGFATQAQKIEEESAKIGMELIKEAIDDFREESKDWKSKYNTELKDWEVLGGRIRDMVGDDAKAIAVLRKGKPYASDFAKTAVAVAKARGFDSPADLVDFGESTLPKNIDVMDWVRSGAPDMSLEAKPVLDKGMFENMKTGVFKRQIYPEGMGRIERTEETYLDLPVGVRKDVIPEAKFTDIYSTLEVPGRMSSTEEERYRKAVLGTLASRSSAVGGVSFDTAGNPIYKIDNAEAQAQIEKDADRIMDRIINMYSASESIETAPSVNDARDIARQFAESDVSNLAQRYDLGRGQQQQQPPAGGNQQQQQQQSQQTGGAITQAMVNSQQYQSAVNPPSTAQPMSKLARRGALVNYLTSQGISQQDAVAHAQQAIQ
jgi:hypothetical protein